MVGSSFATADSDYVNDMLERKKEVSVFVCGICMCVLSTTHTQPVKLICVLCTQAAEEKVGELKARLAAIMTEQDVGLPPCAPPLPTTGAFLLALCSCDVTVPQALKSELYARFGDSISLD